MYKKHYKEILFQMLESGKVKNEKQKKKLRRLGANYSWGWFGWALLRHDIGTEIWKRQGNYACTFLRRRFWRQREQPVQRPWGRYILDRLRTADSPVWLDWSEQEENTWMWLQTGDRGGADSLRPCFPLQRPWCRVWRRNDTDDLVEDGSFW